MTHSASIARRLATPTVPSLVASVAGMALFALLTALAGTDAVRIPVPYSPVPMTLQTIPVLLSGFVLGCGWGAGSMVLFVVLGILGAPVFVGGTSGVAHVYGATGGYLIGFVLAPLVVGAMMRPDRGNAWRIAAAAALATALILCCGVAWLAVLRGSLSVAVTEGLAPFLVDALVKLLLVTLVGRAWFEVKKLRISG